MMASSPFELEVTCESPLWDPYVSKMQQALWHKLGQEVLEAVFPPGALLKPLHIHIFFTTNDTVAHLNKEHRGREGGTNVLSFHQFDTVEQILEEIAHPHIHALELGDLVFSDHVVLDEARRYERPVEHHLAHLFVHGLLHLLGYDHQTPEEQKQMETLEISLLKKNSIPDPY